VTIETVMRSIEDHLTVAKDMEHHATGIERLASSMITAIKHGGKILWVGNGGSAADCQHLAAELVGRFNRERAAIPSIALTTDSSILTSVGNDYGFEQVFVRQVEALCSPQDFLVGISTSGNSGNVLAALQRAKRTGAGTAVLTGRGGHALADFVDHCICVDSNETARIQEMHILVGHILCDLVERAADVGPGAGANS
jgi:D-sedoheptulose 7-phosphate isomerase